MPRRTEAEDVLEAVGEMRSARYETLIAWNRGLVVLSFLLCMLLLVGWHAHRSSLAAQHDELELQLRNAERLIRNVERLTSAHNKALQSQVEWNDMILKAIWMLNVDPKRVEAERRLRR